MAGVHQWKHGKKGSGVYWLQQAGDEFRLGRIAQQLFDSVGKSISEESFKVKYYQDIQFLVLNIDSSAPVLLMCNHFFILLLAMGRPNRVVGF